MGREPGPPARGQRWRADAAGSVDRAALGPTRGLPRAGRLRRGLHPRRVVRRGGHRLRPAAACRRLPRRLLSCGRELAVLRRLGTGLPAAVAPGWPCRRHVHAKAPGRGGPGLPVAPARVTSEPIPLAAAGPGSRAVEPRRGSGTAGGARPGGAISGRPPRPPGLLQGSRPRVLARRAAGWRRPGAAPATGALLPLAHRPGRQPGDRGVRSATRPAPPPAARAAAGRVPLRDARRGAAQRRGKGRTAAATAAGDLRRLLRRPAGSRRAHPARRAGAGRRLRRRRPGRGYQRLGQGHRRASVAAPGRRRAARPRTRRPRDRGARPDPPTADHAPR